MIYAILVYFCVSSSFKALEVLSTALVCCQNIILNVTAATHVTAATWVIVSLSVSK